MIDYHTSHDIHRPPFTPPGTPTNSLPDCTSKSHLWDRLQVLAGNPFAHILLLQDIFNQKGILWSRRDQHRSVEILQQAEELYKAWTGSLPEEESPEQPAGAQIITCITAEQSRGDLFCCCQSILIFLCICGRTAIPKVILGAHLNHLCLGRFHGKG